VLAAAALALVVLGALGAGVEEKLSPRSSARDRGWSGRCAAIPR
jgi:hypothetical protein